MPGDYAVLAPVYDVAGLSTFSTTIIPSLLTYILQRGWMGRNILELGSGTGLTLRWIKHQGYNISGVDNSPEMIQQAQKQTYAVPLYQQDVRRLEFNNDNDLVIALNLLNELDSLRDLEATFKGVQQALKAGQMFVFDLQTLEGLAKSGNSERLFYDSPDSLTMFTRSTYDYERQLLNTQYLLYRQEEGQSLWQRSQAEQTLRGYPVQAVLGLLQRTGFELTGVLNGALAAYDPGKSGVDRVIVVAKRV
ncbi:MAG TPA: class I SAM-dependent methyltransferase [Phototrophicaceae bacterium]|jgi:SAM-dependent methyltransferase|nr:class I SAM-dependent methyltransferase [Phototrophicaceae bacterium]